MAARNTPRSVVYVIRSDKSGQPLLKIGTTTDLHRRLNELRRRTQGTVTLLATWPGDDTLERQLHHLCRADLVAGEWFRPSDQVLALVARMRGRQGAATPSLHPRALPGVCRGRRIVKRPSSRHMRRWWRTSPPDSARETYDFIDDPFAGIGTVSYLSALQAREHLDPDYFQNALDTLNRVCPNSFDVINRPLRRWSMSTEVLSDEVTQVTLTLDTAPEAGSVARS
jgi:hypothetical protein